MSAEKPRDEVQPEEDGSAAGKGGFVADAVRKAVLAGLGAVFLTEEGARKLARDWKLPKELISYVVSQAAGAKTEVMRVVSDEIRRFMQSDALRREFIRALTSMSIEVTAEIRLKDAGGGRVKPAVKASVRPRAARREPEPEPDAGGEP
jgi:hypothetical protein